MNPKCRILFVDDEPLLLEGMRRQLHGMRHEWDMDFEGSGAVALALLEKSPHDVVVSDMRMPGMNGAELLKQVMKRYPQTVRMILSGYVDRELIMECVDSTHQYLSKPCGPDALRAAIMRANILSLSLPDGPIRRLVSQMDRLPSLPKLYVELVKALEDPQISPDQVASVIARDIGMTAKILKLVNSAFFGLGHEIANPMEAVVYLGHAMIKSLVLSMKVFSQFNSARLPGLCLDTLWEHSLSTAVIAKEIARTTQADPKLMDEAFVAGMLHDAGRLVLATNLSEQYCQAVQRAREKRIPLFQAELEVFNTTHAEVGGYLLGLWGLPVPVVEAITFHHFPARSADRKFSPLTTVHAADALLQEQASIYEGVAPAQLDMDYLQALGLSGCLEEWRESILETVPQKGVAR